MGFNPGQPGIPLATLGDREQARPTEGSHCCPSGCAGGAPVTMHLDRARTQNNPRRRAGAWANGKRAPPGWRRLWPPFEPRWRYVLAPGYHSGPEPRPTWHHALAAERTGRGAPPGWRDRDRLPGPLEVRTRERMPLGWAMTQNNLGARCLGWANGRGTARLGKRWPPSGPCWR